MMFVEEPTYSTADNWVSANVGTLLAGSRDTLSVAHGDLIRDVGRCLGNTMIIYLHNNMSAE